MNGKGQECQHFYNVIQPGNMLLFVQQDVCLLILGQTGRKIDPGTENAQNKGRADPVCQKNLFPDRNGGGGFPPADCPYRSRAGSVNGTAKRFQEFYL